VRSLAGLLATSVVLGGFGAYPAPASTTGGANHLVLATATAGNSSTKSGIQVASVGAPAVSADNIARAISEDCTGCRAVAAAMQSVFITRNASTITPGNVAAAINSQCTGCDSFAFAYQYVLMTHGPVYLTAAAKEKLAQLRQQIAATVASGLSDAQLDSQLQALGCQFRAIIDQDLRQAGVTARGNVYEHTESTPAGG
jgi:hypothetical protein